MQALLEDEELCLYWASVSNVNAEAIRQHAWRILVGNRPGLHEAINAA